MTLMKKTNSSIVFKNGRDWVDLLSNSTLTCPELASGGRGDTEARRNHFGLIIFNAF